MFPVILLVIFAAASETDFNDRAAKFMKDLFTITIIIITTRRRRRNNIFW